MRLAIIANPSNNNRHSRIHPWNTEIETRVRHMLVRAPQPHPEAHDRQKRDQDPRDGARLVPIAPVGAEERDNEPAREGPDGEELGLRGGVAEGLDDGGQEEGEAVEGRSEHEEDDKEEEDVWGGERFEDLAPAETVDRLDGLAVP